MDPIGLLLVIGGLALVVGGLVLRLPGGPETSIEQATTAESLEAINRYLQEIRRQRNDDSERPPGIRSTPTELGPIAIAPHVAARAGHVR